MSCALYGFIKNVRICPRSKIVIGKIDVCKWFCGWCLDNVDDRVKCVSINPEMKKDIEDIRRLVTSFNTNKPTYASKVSEKKTPTKVCETCTDNRNNPNEQTLYIPGTIDDDILFPSVLQN